MIKPTCSICGAHPIGYLDSWPSVWVCGYCKEMSLRFMHQRGVEMTADNPLIHDLCNNSHYFERVAYSFNIPVDSERFRTFYITPPSLMNQVDSQQNFFEPLDILGEV